VAGTFPVKVPATFQRVAGTSPGKVPATFYVLLDMGLQPS